MHNRRELTSPVLLLRSVAVRFCYILGERVTGMLNAVSDATLMEGLVYSEASSSLL